jgi:DNA-binding transcriptional regulator YdaS (Cro superfamily)
MSVVERVIETLGGVTATARALGVKHTSVIGWRDRQRIPAEKVSEVARLTKIPAAEIRPDLARLFEAA